MNHIESKRLDESLSLSFSGADIEGELSLTLSKKIKIHPRHPPVVSRGNPTARRLGTLTTTPPTLATRANERWMTNDDCDTRCIAHRPSPSSSPPSRRALVVANAQPLARAKALPLHWRRGRGTPWATRRACAHARRHVTRRDICTKINRINRPRVPARCVPPCARPRTLDITSIGRAS